MSGWAVFAGGAASALWGYAVGLYVGKRSARASEDKPTQEEK